MIRSTDRQIDRSTDRSWAIPDTGARFIGEQHSIPPLAISEIIGGLARGVAAKWSRTQSKSLLEQFDWGIRYFDLRFFERGNELWLHHGLYSCEIEEALAPLAARLKSAPSEIIILDVRIREASGNYVSRESWSALVNIVSGAFGSRLASHGDPDYLKIDSRVREFWSKGKSVVFHVDEGELAQAHNFIYGPDLIDRRWPQEDDPRTMLGKFRQNLQKATPSGKIAVDQGIVTPTFGSILGSLARHLELGAEYQTS